MPGTGASPELVSGPGATPGTGPAPVAVALKPARRRWPLVVAALVAVAVLLAGGGAAVWAFTSRDASPQGTLRPLPKPLVQEFLDARAKALLAGDEKGWLAGVDKALVPDQMRLYANLRAMEIGHYAYRIRSVGRVTGSHDKVVASLSIGYCFGVSECRAPESESAVSFRLRGDKLKLTGYEAVGDERPWEVGELRAAVGDRVVVAAQPKFAGRLPKYLRLAERKARYAARYRPGDAGKQVLVVGVPNETTGRWYDGTISNIEDMTSFEVYGRDPERVAASEAVLRADKAGKTNLPWEFGLHTALGAAKIGTLTTSAEGFVEVFWLPMGVALDAAYDHEIHRYEVAADMRTLLRGWHGELAKLHEYRGPEWSLAAWATVSLLMIRFGEKRFIRFFDAVARDGKSYREAAKQHLGASLANVQKHLLAQLRGLT